MLKLEGEKSVEEGFQEESNWRSEGKKDLALRNLQESVMD